MVEEANQGLLVLQISYAQLLCKRLPFRSAVMDQYYLLKGIQPSFYSHLLCSKGSNLKISGMTRSFPVSSGKISRLSPNSQCTWSEPGVLFGVLTLNSRFTVSLSGLGHDIEAVQRKALISKELMLCFSAIFSQLQFHFVVDGDYKFAKF